MDIKFRSVGKRVILLLGGLACEIVYGDIHDRES